MSFKGMWYLRRVAYEYFGPVSTCLCPKYITCCFQNFVNVREDESERIDRLLLVLKMKKKLISLIILFLLMLVNYILKI